MFVMKLDPEGAYLWAGVISGDISAGLETGTFAVSQRMRIAADSDENVLLAGNFGRTVDFDPGEGVYSLGNGDTFFLKLDPAGNLVWVNVFAIGGSPGNLGADSAGNVYAAGLGSESNPFGGGPFKSVLPQTGNLYMYALRFIPQGDLVWSERAVDDVGTQASSGTVWLNNGIVDVNGISIRRALPADAWIWIPRKV